MNNYKPALQSGRAGIAQLAADLRNPMPKGFVWDFMTTLESGNSTASRRRLKENFGPRCSSAGCAMGFAQIFYSNVPEYDRLNDVLQMPYEDFQKIFWNEENYDQLDADDISPEDVAQALEEYLKASEHS